MTTDPGHLRAILAAAVERARPLTGGAPAGYIPELAKVDPDAVSAAVTLADGTRLTAGDADRHRFTLQSAAKVVLLAAMLEEAGEERVFAHVGTEPSGTSFASIARLETHGPVPANPLVNAGAIALCSLIPGDRDARVGWLAGWLARLAGEPLAVNRRVHASEAATGDRNRAIAYFLKSQGALEGDVETALDTYFSLCSFEAGVGAVSRLAAVLATGGVAPAADPAGGERLLSRRAAAAVVALMATCGMYDESGVHLLRTGLPAKSGVSGVILAVATGRAGIAVASPRVNDRGGSVRGHRILAELSAVLDWHFALA